MTSLNLNDPSMSSTLQPPPLSTPTPTNPASAAQSPPFYFAYMTTPNMSMGGVPTFGDFLKQNSLAIPLTEQDLIRSDQEADEERLKLSRERNRVHAREMRQRKKIQVRTLELRVDQLKLEQLRLKQIINDRKTADIMLAMVGGEVKASSLTAKEEAAVDHILKRDHDEIPDGRNVRDKSCRMMPSLATMYSTNGGKIAPPSPDAHLYPAAADVMSDTPIAGEEGDFNYALLTKDRATCSPAELDLMRKERNRMHAKRTRDRKKIFNGEMAKVIEILDEENLKLMAMIQTEYTDTYSEEERKGDDESASGSLSGMGLVFAQNNGEGDSATGKEVTTGEAKPKKRRIEASVVSCDNSSSEGSVVSEVSEGA